MPSRSQFHPVHPGQLIVDRDATVARDLDQPSLRRLVSNAAGLTDQHLRELIDVAEQLRLNEGLTPERESASEFAPPCAES